MEQSALQAYLSEANEPSVRCHTSACEALGLLVPEAGEVLQQAALYSRLLGTAEMTEVDDELRQLIQEGFQRLGALRREASRLEDTGRRVATILRELDQWHNRLRDRAAPADYGTQGGEGSADELQS